MSKKIGIDTIGGEKPLIEVIKGFKLYIEDKKEDSFFPVFYGDKNKIEEAIGKVFKTKTFQYEVKHILKGVNKFMSPFASIKEKDTIVDLMIKDLNANIIDGIVTPSPTIQTVSKVAFNVPKILPEVSIAFAPEIINLNNEMRTLYLDCGASVEPSADNLVNYAFLGIAYFKALGIENPTVGLINNGSEKNKGNKVYLEAYKKLEKLNEQKKLKFIGNQETNKFLLFDANVVVVDGFTGNLVLKGIEGASMYILRYIKRMFTGSFRGILAFLLLSKDLKKILKLADFRRYGNAVILGINKLVVKVHGNAESIAYNSSFLKVHELLNSNFIEIIKEILKK